MKWRPNPKLGDLSIRERAKKVFGTSELPSEAHSLEEYKIPALDEAIPLILNAVEKNYNIWIIGDYDCDGVGSTYGIIEILRTLGHERYTVRIPKRISEGYGMNQNIVDEVTAEEMGLCILVDNGITAAEYTDQIRDFGWDIIILDHHEAPEDGNLPNVDVLVDPEAIDTPDQGTFKHYCAAGLVYKLAEQMLDSDEVKTFCKKKGIPGITAITVNKILSMSAVSTCADSVSLVDEENGTYVNWLLLKKGMKTLTNKSFRTNGLYVLLRSLNLDYHIDETDIGFKVAPCINAVGRLEDDGAMKALELVSSDEPDFIKLQEMADELVSYNNKRKDVQKDTAQLIEDKMGGVEIKHNLLVVYEPDISEGILGLIAGKISEAHKVSCIALSDSKEPGIVKGSVRAYGDYDIKALLDKAKDLLNTYGGHKAAAGLSIKASCEKDVLDFKERIEALSGDYVKQEADVFYDIALSECDINEGLQILLKQYAPYGAGNPAPIFLLKDAELNGKYGYYDLVGATKNTIRLQLDTMKALNFTGAGKEKYLAIGEPKVVDLIGEVSENNFGGKTSLQFIFSDVREACPIE